MARKSARKAKTENSPHTTDSPDPIPLGSSGNDGGRSSDYPTILTINLIRFFTALVERFGWPGMLIFLGFYCAQTWSSAEQKRKWFDKYILGEGMSPWWPFILVGLLLLFTVWAQRVTYKKKLRIMQEELDRIGREKSRLQELVAGRPWQHVDDIARTEKLED